MAKKTVRKIQTRQQLMPAPLGVPSEFSKIGDIGQALETSWAKIPSYLYDFASRCLPLTVAEFESDFNSIRSVFSCGPGTCADGQQTNATCASGVNEAFLATGLCIIAFGEGEAFSQSGAVVATPAAEGATPAIGVSAGVGGYEGIVNLSESVAGAQHAQLNWGSPTWRLIEKYFKNTRLQMNVNRRFQVVDESLMDIGMCPTPPKFVGASSSLLGTQNFIRSVNETLQLKDLGQQFLTANTSASDAGLACIPPPRAGVTFGHPEITGLANRIYCFPQPILFVPSMRFDINLVPVGCESECDDMLATATMTGVSQSSLFSEGVAGVAGSCGVVYTIPGGSISIGVVMKGFSLWPQACLQYILNFIMPGSAQAAMIGSEGGAMQYINGLQAKTPSMAGKTNKFGYDLAGTLGAPPSYRQGQQ